MMNEWVVEIVSRAILSRTLLSRSLLESLLYLQNRSLSWEMGKKDACFPRFVRRSVLVSSVAAVNKMRTNCHARAA